MPGFQLRRPGLDVAVGCDLGGMHIGSRPHFFVETVADRVVIRILRQEGAGFSVHHVVHGDDPDIVLLIIMRRDIRCRVSIEKIGAHGCPPLWKNVVIKKPAKRGFLPDRCSFHYQIEIDSIPRLMITQKRCKVNRTKGKTGREGSPFPDTGEKA